MYSHLSKNYISFPILIIITTAIILITDPDYAYAQDDAQYRACSDSQAFECANLQNVRYPFWESGKTEYCGHPGFELNCSSSTAAEITIKSVAYRVLSMNQDTHSLTVARADYWGDSCSGDREGATLDDTLFEYSSGTQNLTLYYTCTSSTPPSQYQFSCPGDATGSTNFFVTEAFSRAAAFGNINVGNCGENVVLQISDSSADKLESAAEASLTSALESGFGIAWTLNDSQCEACITSQGICGSDNVTKEFNCYCKDGPSSSSTCNSSPSPDGSPEGSSSKHNPIIGIAAGVSAWIFISSIMLICYYRRNRKLSKAIIFWRRDKVDEFDVEAFLRNYGSLAPKRYSYAQVKKMTNSFAENIGKGGYGVVYKGKLPDGCLVAVKMLKECKGNGEEFMNEVASIGRTSHVNVVTLLGFSLERKKRALVYEYMPNGSLDRFIFNQESSNVDSCLEWKTLYEIAVGIARGLEYLHRGCNTTILHFDIKPQNILLDKDLCPKISDFGLAKLWLMKDNTVSIIGARGTIGYIAPEVFSRTYGRVSNKSDVYSYGMLVLEMVGGRKNFDSGVSRTSEIYFPNRIYKDLEMDNNLTILGDQTEEEKELLKKMLLVSFWCIQTNPSDRPSMSKVVDMLQGSLQSLEVPPKPFLFSPTRSLQQSPTPSL